jgi:hypothetical protein
VHNHQKLYAKNGETMRRIFPTAAPQEVAIDAQALADVLRMFHSMPAIQIARDAFLSMSLCGPFGFRIPRMGLRSNADMERIIERYWMPWLRTAYDWIKMVGVCPYYFERKGEHLVPLVPDIELGDISVLVNSKTHKVEYRWRWTHGLASDATTVSSEGDKNMYWVISDYAPSCNGQLRSPLASLLPSYRSILILQQSLEVASAQCARPTHVMEYHPQPGTARNDNLTQLVATFGEKAAGLSQARQEMAKAQEIRVRTSELMRQLRDTAEGNASYTGAPTKRRLLWTDFDEDAVDRYDSGLSSRIFPLRPDFKYVAPQKASVVADLDKHLREFNIMAAARMDFSIEFVQPTGSRGGTNFAGAERFENERIKEALGFFTSITKTALILAYRKQFEQGFAQASEWKRRHPRRTGGSDASDVADMYPELDVEVYMSCTPFVGYNELRAMWIDGIMSKETFAHHVFHMRAMQEEEIEIGEQVQDLNGTRKTKKSKTFDAP